ncbi:MAG: helix-turn-helix domain-containing protein [Gammaproteobacteria bacterium]
MFQNSEQQLISLGQFLRLARKRRGWRQEDVAQRLSIGIDTVKRAEKGHKGLSIGHVFDLLSLYQRLDSFSEVINPNNDVIGISNEDERLPQRISGKHYDRDF